MSVFPGNGSTESNGATYWAEQIANALLLTLIPPPYSASEENRLAYILSQIYLAISGGGGGGFWSLDGNATTGTKSLGTTNSNAIQFITNNTSRGSITSAGQWNVIGGGHAGGITLNVRNDDNSKSFQFTDAGALGRDGQVWSLASGTTVTWGQSAGVNNPANQCVFVGYFSGVNCTSANVVAISSSTSNSVSANYGMGTITIGSGALINSTGVWNVAYGVNAGSRNTIGGSNLYLGGYADRDDTDPTISNNTGHYNIVMGGVNLGASKGTAFVGGNAFSSVFAVHGQGYASHQMVFGGGNQDVFFTDMYAGYGVVNTEPGNFTLHASSGLGEDIFGADLIMAAGQPTGAGTGGSFKIQTAPAGSSSSDLQSLVDRVIVDENGAFTITQLGGTGEEIVITDDNGTLSKTSFTTKSQIVVFDGTSVVVFTPTDLGFIVADASSPTGLSSIEFGSEVGDVPEIGANFDNNEIVATNVSGQLVTKTLDQVRGYAVYTALLTQTGSNAPVANVLENTLGGTVVWTRDGAGNYTATLAGAFPANTAIFMGAYLSNTCGSNTGWEIAGDDDYIKLFTTKVSGTLDDDILLSTVIEIRVYP